jgi:carboxypeptidase C (cathepsin A)
MRIQGLPLLTVAFALTSVSAYATETVPAPAMPATKGAADKIQTFLPEQQASKGSVTIGGKRVDYDAYAGTLVVHLPDYDDVPQNTNKEDKVGPAEASMFYAAYIKSGEPSAHRPVTFIFNGGPGSSSVWLHMGAFGPRRVLTANDSHTAAAPYAVVNNEVSLLDVSDLVFIDAPGTGFSRIAGKDHDKAFFGVDADAHAFADFISQFLAKYGRWNSPKYLFGESYGTTRSAVLINLLAAERSVDFNGVIMLSQILSFDNSPDGVESNPGVDQAYELVLPTFAASAWYHHKLPDAPKDLATLLKEVEHFALTDYALALQAGANLEPQQREAIIARLHQYTGLPEAYIGKANLRVTGGEFDKTLQDDAALTTGRLDSRFSGPTLDPLSKEAEYDPQSSAISSAYVSALNDYVRKDLKFGEQRAFRPIIDIWKTWNFLHQPPGAPGPLMQSTNVMPDLAAAMKTNPNLKVMLNAGYYDLATPYFQGVYEMQHLPIPASLQKNIEYKFYESGHMVYAHEASAKALHDNVADFIRRTDNIPDTH